MKTNFFTRFSVIFLAISLLLVPTIAEVTYARSSGGATWIDGPTLAQFANDAVGNSGYGQQVRAAIVYEAAHIFCGSGFSLQYVSNGTYYLSKDRLKRVRVSTKASGIFQANFEKFSQTGYSNTYRISNYHVNIE